MKRYRLVPAVRKDLDDIWMGTATHGGEAMANRLLDELYDLFLLIGRLPAAGRSRSDLGAGLRTFPCGDYLVYYRSVAAHTIILRVIHARRDQKKALRS